MGDLHVLDGAKPVGMRCIIFMLHKEELCWQSQLHKQDLYIYELANSLLRQQSTYNGPSSYYKTHTCHVKIQPPHLLVCETLKLCGEKPWVIIWIYVFMHHSSQPQTQRNLCHGWHAVMKNTFRSNTQILLNQHNMRLDRSLLQERHHLAAQPFKFSSLTQTM